MTNSAIELSKENVSRLPKQPGVYTMRDADGQVVYIGKAINLRNRVRSYITGGDGRQSIPYLMERAVSVETLVTENERQAIVLESDLIKKYKPRYNVRLKDDKAHLIAKIDMKAKWPRIELTRKIKNDKAKYIGPFAFSYELRALLEVIKKSIPLRTCSDKIFKNRVRPCLEHQIKRCSAPCCLDVDSDDYGKWVKQAIDILEGRDKGVVKDMRKQMEKASEELRFEDAATLRDRLEVLEKVTNDRTNIRFSNGRQDAFALYRVGERVELSVLLVRNGLLREAKTFGFENVHSPDEDILSSLMSQFYSDTNTIPDEIVIPFELEDQHSREELYTELRGLVTKINVPKQGAKKRLVELAKENARENFNVRYGEKKLNDVALSELKTELRLDEMPRTIECVDISHFQGGHTVASVVFFQDGEPDKSRYRHYNIDHLDKPDDFESMRYIVERHLKSAVKKGSLVDLMVIDGGPGQLSQALKIRKELELSQPAMIGLAKKREKGGDYITSYGGSSKPERVYHEKSTAPVVLKANSEALHLLERVRNEAHRFAITFHRKQRSKKTFVSKLDQIAGVGPARRLALLKEFGSVEAISKQSAEALQSKCSIPQKLAEKILKELSE